MRNGNQLTSHTLRALQSGTDEEVYYCATNIALYMAAGGYLEQANTLLSGLWKYRLPHSRNTWLPDTAFMVLWHAAGKYPAYIPFAINNIDSIEKNMRGYIALDAWGGKMPAKPWQELTGQDLLRKAYNTAALVKGNGGIRMDLNSIREPSPGNEPASFSEHMDKISQYIKSVSVEVSDSFPSPQDELEALAMLEKLFREWAADPDALVLAAELAARNGRTDAAIRFAKMWAKGFFSNNLNHGLALMSASRHVAPLLLQGIVAGELKLDESIVQEYLPRILSVLDRRITQGRSLAFGDLSWKTLLEKISLASIAFEDQLYDETIHQTGWIGFEGVDRNEIARAEKRLGVILPEDYKSFLEITNGFRSFPLTNPALLPVTAIDYLRNVLEPSLYDIMASYPVQDMDEQTYQDLLSNAILISHYPDEQMVWLMPESIERKRWQTWFYAAWSPGETPYPSFRFYMEEQLESIIVG